MLSPIRGRGLHAAHPTTAIVQDVPEDVTQRVAATGDTLTHWTRVAVQYPLFAMGQLPLFVLELVRRAECTAVIVINKTKAHAEEWRMALQRHYNNTYPAYALRAGRPIQGAHYAEFVYATTMATFLTTSRRWDIVVWMDEDEPPALTSARVLWMAPHWVQPSALWFVEHYAPATHYGEVHILRSPLKLPLEHVMLSACRTWENITEVSKHARADIARFHAWPGMCSRYNNKYTTKMELVRQSVYTILEAPVAHVVVSTQFFRLEEEVQALLTREFPDVNVFVSDTAITSRRVIDSLMHAWGTPSRALVIMRTVHPYFETFASVATHVLLLDGSQDMTAVTHVWKSGHAQIWYPTVELGCDAYENPELLPLVGRVPRLLHHHQAFVVLQDTPNDDVFDNLNLFDLLDISLDELFAARGASVLANESVALTMTLCHEVLAAVRETMPLFWMMTEQRGVNVDDLFAAEQYLDGVARGRHRDKLATAWLLKIIMEGRGCHSMHLLRIGESMLCYLQQDHNVHVLAVAPPLASVDRLCAYFPCHMQIKLDVEACVEPYTEVVEFTSPEEMALANELMCL